MLAFKSDFFKAGNVNTDGPDVDADPCFLTFIFISLFVFSALKASQ